MRKDGNQGNGRIKRWDLTWVAKSQKILDGVDEYLPIKFSEGR